MTVRELRCALSRCVESAVGLDGFPYSLFKVMFPWWQSALVKLWGAVPSLWKHSIIVPILKQGDQSSPGNFRPVLQSVGALGFRWGADALVGSLVYLVTMRASTHTLSPLLTSRRRSTLQCSREGPLPPPFVQFPGGRLWSICLGTFSECHSPMGVSVPLQIWCWPHQISSDGVRAQTASPRL